MSEDKQDNATDTTTDTSTPDGPTSDDTPKTDSIEFTPEQQAELDRRVSQGINAGLKTHQERFETEKQKALDAIKEEEERKRLLDELKNKNKEYCR